MLMLPWCAKAIRQTMPVTMATFHYVGVILQLFFEFPAVASRRIVPTSVLTAMPYAILSIKSICLDASMTEGYSLMTLPSKSICNTGREFPWLSVLRCRAVP